MMSTMDKDRTMSDHNNITTDNLFFFGCKAENKRR